MATSPASASGNQATILDDDNWPIWSIRTEGLLIEAGLWSVVTDGVTPLPTAPAPNATQEERAAYAVELARSRADSALDRKAKAFIQRHTQRKTPGKPSNLNSPNRQSRDSRSFSLLCMEPGESVARFYARLQQLLTELEACNCETSESTVVLAILAALPPEYESTVERLRYDQTSADLKVERIKRVLLTKEADLLSKQMQQQLSTSSSSLWSYSSPSDSKGAGSSGGQGGRGRFRLPQQQQQQQQQARTQSPDRSTRDVSSHAHLTCNYCAKPGHIMSECFTFDRDQRNRMRTLFSNPARPSSPGRRPSPGRSSSPARTSSPSRGRAQTPGRAAAQSPSRGASLFTCSTAAAADDDDDDLDDVLMQMVQPRLNFNSDLYSPFCIDSGASQHILKDLQFFYNYTPFAPDKHRPVRLAAEGHRVWAVGSGSVFLSTKRGSWFLSHALYVPDSKQNFISVTAATDDGSSFLFRGDVCQISCNQFGSMLRVNAHKVRNSYILAAVPMPDGPDTDSEPEQLYNIQQSALQPDPRVKLELLTNVAAPSANSSTSDSPQVWHQRLCHTSYDALARMQSAGMVSGVPVTAAQFRAAASDPAVCVGCVKGKQHKNVAFAGPPPNAAPVTAPLGLIHMDVCGPMHARARDGSLYVATFLDEHTKLSVCVPISSKAQVPDTVRTVIEQLETQSGYRCKAIRTDNGTEYVNSRMREYCASKGIVHQHSAPYSPQQNGAAERLNRTIFEKARSIIHSADISLSFWAHAVKFANHVRCLLPVSGQPLTPWEAFYGVKPDLSGLRVFGCRVWLHIPDHQRSKLQAKSIEGLFLGYEPGSKAYRVLVNGRETCSKDIVFDELSVLQPTRQQDQPAQPVFLLPLPPSPANPSEPLSPAAPAEGGNSLQQTNSSSSEDSGSSSSSSSGTSSSSRPGSSAQRPQSRPLESIGAHQDSSSSDSLPSEQEPGQHVSLTARYEPGSHMWHQQQLELISKLPRPGIGRFSLRSMPLARETAGAQPAAAPAAARPAAPAAASAAARTAAPAAAPAAARPAAPAAAPPAAPAAVRPTASAAAPTAARPAAPVTAAARPAAAARPGLAQPALRVPLIPTSAAARQAAPAVHPSMPMPPAHDPRPASPEAPAAPVPRRNPSRERHLPERFRDSDLFAMNVSDSPVNDTPTVAEALAGPMADLWIEAMNAELASLHANQTWCLEERPANARVLPTKWVLKVKRDAAGNIEKLKARLVAKGFYQQSGVDVGDVYAPVSKHTTLRTLLAKAAAEDMEIHQLDFETAFLNGKLEPGEVIYVQQPEGFEEGSTNTVCRLQKALYGLRQAPRAWHARLCEELLSMGFKASEADPALFTLQLSTGMVYLLVYVDDCLLCTQQGDTAGLAYVKKQLSSAFKLKDLGEARWFLGMQLTRDRAEGTIKLDQHKFIQELVTAHSKSAAHSKPLPMAPAVKLVREGDALDTTLHHYSALVGSLLYLTCCTRPDIAFAVGAMARHMSAPTKQHWAAACSVLCYLKGTADQGLLFGGVSGLQGFSDADYAGDKDTARSTTGYIFTLNGGAISWSSRLQPTVAMSTAEAEYMAASSAAKEALWLRKLMRDLQLDASCVHLGCDNQAAIQLLHNPMATSRAKHIDVHHHFVRERISRGEVAFHYCHTSSMLADILTKPLAAVQFNMGKQGSLQARKCKLALTQEQQRAQSSMQYIMLLPKVLKKLTNCAAVEACKLGIIQGPTLGPYEPLGCSLGLAQQLMSSFPGLTSLSLHGYAITCSGLAALLAHPQLNLQLQQLDLSSTIITHAEQPEPGAATLASLFHASRLKQLSLLINNISEHEPLLPNLQPLCVVRIKELWLTMSDVDMAAKQQIEMQPLVAVLQALKHCSWERVVPSEPGGARSGARSVNDPVTLRPSLERVRVLMAPSVRLLRRIGPGNTAELAHWGHRWSTGNTAEDMALLRSSTRISNICGITSDLPADLLCPLLRRMLSVLSAMAAQTLAFKFIPVLLMRASPRETAATDVAQEHLHTVRNSRRSQNDSHGTPNRCAATEAVCESLRLMAEQPWARWLDIKVSAAGRLLPAFELSPVAGTNPAPPPAPGSSSAGTSMEANLKHITVTLATWNAVWEVYLDPEWARQRLRLERLFEKVVVGGWLEEEVAGVSMERHKRVKQLTVFFGMAGIGTRGGWGADAVLRACCKVACRPRGTDQQRGRVVPVDELFTSQPPCSQAASQPAASEPGPSTPPPAKRSKCTQAEQAAEPTQPNKGIGKGKVNAAKARPTPQPGRWLNRDCNAALNIQRIGESRWRPLELCWWPDQAALPAKGRDYPGLGYKRLRDKPLKAQPVRQASDLNNVRLNTQRWLAPIQPHLENLAAASSAGTSLEANLTHINVTQAIWDAVWDVYLDPKWARQRLRLYGAQDRALEQVFKKVRVAEVAEVAEVSMERQKRAKQLVVFFAAAGIGTRGGWGADAVLRACCKVACRPRGTDQRRAWSQKRDQPVWDLMWCSPRILPQPPCSQAATQPAVSEPGPSTPPPAKRSKRTMAVQAAEPTQPNKGIGKGKVNAAKAKPTPQPGMWLDRDCNAALDMQRIGESRWRPLELCWWPDQAALPAKGREYPGLVYKRLRDKPPEAQQQ
ncbi:hypothetical protein QJQ45_007415 [Haematococcus lacustris]|nr:hypothetical protein QJQ45_007415 [Haematococcus lacustris]